MMHTRTLLPVAMLAAATFAWSGSSAVAADGITVTGTGDASSKPTSLQINAVVSADAQLTADAVVKFNDARKKALAAIDALKIPNLTVKPGGMNIAVATDPQAQMMMMNGNAAPSTKAPKTRISESLTLIIGNIDQLKPQDLSDEAMKLVDAGHDAGLQIGPRQPSSYYEMQIMAQSGGAGGSLVEFHLNDTSSLHDQAVKAAMDDARKKAEHLASLAGATLGPVISVQEGAMPAGNDSSNMRQMILAMNGVASATPDDAMSANLTDIHVKAAVTVQFSIINK